MTKSIYSYECAPVSVMQLRALEVLILRSRDAEPFAKKLAIWLIRKSNFLSTPCCVYIPDNERGLWRLGQGGFHGMVSENGTTHLTEIMRAMNTFMRLSQHSGDVLREELQVPGATFWVVPSTDMYSREATEIGFNLDEVEAVELAE